MNKQSLILSLTILLSSLTFAQTFTLKSNDLSIGQVLAQTKTFSVTNLLRKPKRPTFLFQNFHDNLFLLKTY